MTTPDSPGSRGVRVAYATDGEPTPEQLQFATQLGLSGILVWEPRLPGERWWSYHDLLHLRTRCEDAGLRLEAIENTPLAWYDRAMLGLPGRDEQIEAYQETVRNMGRAGIPVLGFHWMPNSVWRTSFTTRGRGDAVVSSFDAALTANAPLTHGRVFTEDDLWETFRVFTDAVVPVAEEAGVRLALHPDDPPVEALGGIPRLFRGFDGFRRAIEIVDSPAFGLNFCMGTWSEMGGDVLEPLRYFLERDRVVYVHFRDVRGAVPRFQECFLGEGNVDLVAFVRTLREYGFDGFMIDDHVPLMVGEVPVRETGAQPTRLARAHATGYMQGLLAAVQGDG